MGTHQHLARSLIEIRDQGGVVLKDGTCVMPEPILVGRNEAKLAALARTHGIARFTTDLDTALADGEAPIFFDAATTHMRPKLLAKAIAARKHVYCEKPVAANLPDALAVVRQAKVAGIRHGVVQLPACSRSRRQRSSCGPISACA
jgi:predicted dehydrogenase